MKAIYKPENLDVENLLSKKEYKQLGIGVYGLVHLVLKKQMLKSGNYYGNYIYLHSSVLKDVLTTRKYKRVIELAEQKGIIEVNDNFAPSHHSKSYRLGRKQTH